MTRVNGTKVFNQHRVELLPGAKEVRVLCTHTHTQNRCNFH